MWCRDQVLTHLALLRSALQAWRGFGGDQVLTHLALLKSALQAWRGVWGLRDQVLTHLALLRPALQAWCGIWARCWRRGVVLCFVLRSFAIQA